MSTLHQALGRYLIEAEIGRGAMGIVYRAYDPQIGRSVAIKTISFGEQGLADDQRYRDRFLREARAAGRLSHPGIVTIYDAGQDSETGEPYLVMEHVAGEPLSRALSRERKLSLSLALQYAQEIAEALDYAHTQGVVHRDIKPANILITEDGHAKIADFGVAWLNQEIAPVGEVVGSPAYMAPEQMAGKQADARSDLFSLGVVLYSMITGFRPFQGNSAQTVCFKVMNIEPVPVTSFQSDVPPELDAIVSRAIAKDPDERYPSGAALARAIQGFRESGFRLSETGSFLAFPAIGSRSPRTDSVAGRLYRRFSLTAAILAIAGSALFLVWRLKNIRNVPLPAAVIAAIRLQPVRPIPGTKANVSPEKLFAHRNRPHRRETKSSISEAASANIDFAMLQVEIQHHFGGAKASIWIDDKLVFDQNLRGTDQRHPFLRALEVDQVTNFKFAPGKHWLQVRVVSPENNYDQIETMDTDLAPGSAHVVYVNCDKRKMQVTLQ